jgi:Asp-tRNA(Asn)/Glu-tRNA(Gln) amidotransferase A subunit family amidase
MDRAAVRTIPDDSGSGLEEEMSEACDLSALEARRRIGRKELSPSELLESCLARIERTNPAVNAIVARDLAAARRAARAVEAALTAGDALGLLAGLPVGVKDLQATAGLTTTSGSLLHKGHVPEADDYSVANMRRAGALLFAKTNTPEFGAGGNTRNRVHGATGNPFAPALTSGGSSGGSAAALALGQVALATGSDYGGSLRTPAAFCGVVGFRPSPGIVPSPDRVAGLIPFPVVGPMGRTVADAHLLLMAQMGRDRRDPFSGDGGSIPGRLGVADLCRLRVAVSADLSCAPVDKAIGKVFTSRVRQFGHVFREVQHRSPDFANVHEIFETLRGVYFLAAHRDRLARSRELLDSNVIDNTERALKLSVVNVSRALAEQTLLAKRFLAFFDEVDVLICPAASVSPFPHAQLFVEEINGERMATYMSWLAITYAPTMALACAVALPCGVDHKGMPFGIQLIGPPGADAHILRAAHALEQVLATNSETARPVPPAARQSDPEAGARATSGAGPAPSHAGSAHRS